MEKRSMMYAGTAVMALACVAVTACGQKTGKNAASTEPVATALSSSFFAAASLTALTSSTPRPTLGSTTRPAVRAASRQCRVRDLALAPIQGNGAAGHVGYDIIVTNTSGTPCALPAGHPVFLSTDPASGRTTVLPTQPAAGGSPAVKVTVAPGARAETVLYMINGYGGYDPSNPACSHPAVYHNLSVRLGDGGLLPLTGLTLDVKCDGVTAYDWTTPPWT